ncbi:uncharacterized protein RHIMIDRAFT_61499 [Rhizopus microsporus ATCC 52813]|uniref:Uncharacterized protein n=1 Tax=Rhizopus microsporus ATCC 52813 TaxID=1340429 RepID=A0A2G4T6U1_RHIZD|nr:uncharacterized protein RHIMIDRAFT_61499 [Rhizopus microsporus ATCC 52813]PHZ16406.1 hypothetical protein RHIMIDRAFT_61499 [Rhizopus microsporus ATCC 52813]
MCFHMSHLHYSNHMLEQNWKRLQSQAIELYNKGGLLLVTALFYYSYCEYLAQLVYLRASSTLVDTLVEGL